MAVYLEVFLERSKLPTFDDWAAVISREGFPLSFPSVVSLAKHGGYLPALLHGEGSGFEFDVSSLERQDEVPDAVSALGVHADAVATFRFHEMDECHAATIGAAVLALLSQGVFFDSQDGSGVLGQQALTQAKEQLAAAAAKEAEEAAKPSGRLTPAKWAEAFEQTLRRVHPDYRLSEDYRGSLVECVRRDATGLLLSQNCIKMHETYRQCFAVLLTNRKLTSRLCSPFVLGSRFDHNSVVQDAYNRDYRAGQKWHVAPKEWHSEHRATERGAQEWVEPCARSAEQFLFPLYVSHLVQGAAVLSSLLSDAARFINEWQVTEETLKQPVVEGGLARTFQAEFGLDSDMQSWNETAVEYFNALCLADAHGVSALRLLKHRADSANVSCADIAMGTGSSATIPSDILNAAILVSYASDFVIVKDQIPLMVQVVEGLKPSRPSSPLANHQPRRRPWWRF